jgi:hypothetical protein
MNYSGNREIEIELFCHDSHWRNEADDEPIPEALAKFVDSCVEWDDEPVSIMFEMTWTGSYTPAYISGPPEDCYPEESEEERDWDVPEVVAGPFEGDDPRRTTLPQEIIDDKEVTAWFDAIVDAEEIDSSEYSECI